MERWPIISTIAVFVLLSSFPATAQERGRPKGQISPNYVREKYIEATGGIDARNRLETAELHGSLSVPPFQNFGSDFHFYSKLPSRDLLKLETRSHGMVSFGHDSDVPYFLASADGVAVMNGVSVRIMEQTLSLLMERDWQRYIKIDVVGVAPLRDRWTYVMRFTSKNGDSQLRYFDSENFMMLRVDYAQRIKPRKGDPDTAYMIQAYFSDFSDAAGVKFPKKIEFRCPAGNLQLSTGSIKTNVPIADSIFKKQ